MGITGSVAAVKGPELVLRLSRDCHMDVRILLTRGGQNFWEKAVDYNPEVWKLIQERIESSKKRLAEGLENEGVEGTIQIHGTKQTHFILKGLFRSRTHLTCPFTYTDALEEWQKWNRLGDSVLHIDLRDWADALMIAPLSAHSLSKLAQGMCDDTLSCVVRAWDFGHGTRPGKPLLLAPAMNTAMWQHPSTRPQLSTIESFWNANNPLHTDTKQKHGVCIVPPQVKTLACGEVGNGAMASVEDMIRSVEEAMETFSTSNSI